MIIRVLILIISLIVLGCSEFDGRTYLTVTNINCDDGVLNVDAVISNDSKDTLELLGQNDTYFNQQFKVNYRCNDRIKSSTGYYPSLTWSVVKEHDSILPKMEKLYTVTFILDEPCNAKLEILDLVLNDRIKLKD